MWGAYSHSCSDKPCAHKMCPRYRSTGEPCLQGLTAVCPGTRLPPRGCFSSECPGTKCAFCKGCETDLQGLEVYEQPPLNKELWRHQPASGECLRAVPCLVWEQGICGGCSVLRTVLFVRAAVLGPRLALGACCLTANCQGFIAFEALYV